MAEGVFCEKVFEMNPNSIGFTEGYFVIEYDQIVFTLILQKYNFFSD